MHPADGLNKKNGPLVRSRGSDPHQGCCRQRRPSSMRGPSTTGQYHTPLNHDNSCPTNSIEIESEKKQELSVANLPSRIPQPAITMILKNLNHRIYDPLNCSTILKSTRYSSAKNSIKKRVRFNADDISRQNSGCDNMVSAYAPVGKRRNSGVSAGRAAPHTEPE